MDGKKILRQYLDRYQGPQKETLERIWQRAEKLPGVIEAYAERLTKGNAEVLKQFEAFVDNAPDEEFNNYMNNEVGFGNERTFSEIEENLDTIEKEGGENMGEKEKGILDYPSMEPGASERQSEINRLKFDAECAKDEARQLAERKADRLWQLEQDLIRKQGGITNAPGNALETWIKNNPEEYGKYQERWDREDRLREEQEQALKNSLPGSSLYDVD